MFSRQLTIFCFALAALSFVLVNFAEAANNRKVTGGYCQSGKAVSNVKNCKENGGKK